MLPQIYRIRPDSARGKKGGIRAHHSTHARDHAVRAQFEVGKIAEITGINSKRILREIEHVTIFLSIRIYG
jgi:hypothetical protein